MFNDDNDDDYDVNRHRPGSYVDISAIRLAIACDAAIEDIYDQRKRLLEDAIKGEMEKPEPTFWQKHWKGDPEPAKTRAEALKRLEFVRNPWVSSRIERINQVQDRELMKLLDLKAAARVSTNKVHVSVSDVHLFSRFYEPDTSGPFRE